MVGLCKRHFCKPAIWLTFAILMLLAGGMTSCNDIDDNPEYRDATVTNIVTYVGYDGGAVFEYTGIDDAPSVTLYTASSVGDNAPVGQRYLMTYYPVGGDETASGVVEPVSLYAVTTLEVSQKDITHYPDWDKSGVFLLSAWRTGRYLNIRCKLPYSDSPRVLALVPSADDDGVLYLAHESPSGATFDRVYYVSFDLTGYIAEHPDLEALEVHINNTNLQENVMTFPL